jgi:hypothetical protein
MFGGTRYRSIAGVTMATVVSLAGCAEPEIDGTAWPSSPLSIELYVGDLAPVPGGREVIVRGQEEPVYLLEPAITSSEHVTAADAYPIAEGVVLEVWFNEEGRERIAAATGANIGRRMVVVIDTVAVSSPAIVQQLRPDLALQIPVRLGPIEAGRLVEAVDQTW